MVTTDRGTEDPAEHRLSHERLFTMTACHDISTWEKSHDGPTGAVAPVRFRHIVVGVDGSSNSIAALRVAAGLGVRDGAKIEAVCVYRPHLHASYPLGGMMVPPYGPAGEGTRDVYASPPGEPDAAADGRATLQHATREAFGTDTIDNLVLHAIDGGRRTTQDVLTTMSSGTDLLVVGARGHSGASGLLLGSTAQACTRHAQCAVLVVPRPEA